MSDGALALADAAGGPAVGRMGSVPRMDLTFTERETAFRDELRAWLEANHPGAEPDGDDDELRVPPRLAADAARGRLGRRLTGRRSTAAAARR